MSYQKIRAEVSDALEKIILRQKQNREAEERFYEFVHRIGKEGTENG